MIDKKDDRLQLRLPTELKKQAKIKALELGYKNGSVSDYIIDLLKKDIQDGKIIIEKEG
jgi:hypothetical protein